LFRRHSLLITFADNPLANPCRSARQHAVDVPEPSHPVAAPSGLWSSISTVMPTIFALEFPHQLGARLQRAAGRQQIVDQQHRWPGRIASA